MHNFFECPICSYPERIKEPFHPAQKPLNLIDHFVKIASNPGNVVFDPFMGLGTTGVSAVRSGRKFVGSELNCEYLTAAERRIASLI